RTLIVLHLVEFFSAFLKLMLPRSATRFAPTRQVASSVKVQKYRANWLDIPYQSNHTPTACHPERSARGICLLPALLTRSRRIPRMRPIPYLVREFSRERH